MSRAELAAHLHGGNWPKAVYSIKVID